MRLTGCCIVEFCAALRVLLPVSDRKQAQSNMPARSNDSWHPRRPLQRRMRSQFRFNYSLKFRQGVISSFFVFHVSPTARTLIITRRRLVAWASSSVLSL